MQSKTATERKLTPKERKERGRLFKAEIIKAASDPSHPAHSSLVEFTEWMDANRESIGSGVGRVLAADQRSRELLALLREGKIEAFLGSPDIDPMTALALLANGHSEAQTLFAKGERPKTKATNRSEVVDEMRETWRSFAGLKAFLAAAERGSVGRGISIVSSELDLTKFTVSCDAVDEAEDVAWSTMQSWWTEAKS